MSVFGKLTLPSTLLIVYFVQIIATAKHNLKYKALQFQATQEAEFLYATLF